MGRSFLAKAEAVIIILLACVPLFVRFPYRVNIFLSWEGAYRISEGQLPFRDFGIPLGGMYWVIPAIFFKLFGAKLITLVKAQVFINIIAGLAFRSILSSLSVHKGIRFASVLLFCLSYSFFNFWPWYNHSVIVYELIALAFLFKYIAGNTSDAERGNNRTAGYSLAWVSASAIFVCFSFLTKQDGGGMAFLIALIILAIHCILEKRWLPLMVFSGTFAAVLCLILLPLSQYGFGYWFNHGQPPHSARVSASDIATEFFGSSQWIKFYFFFTVLLVVIRFRNWKELLADKKEFLLLILTWAILGEAAIFQITSYTPPDNNIFFHSFAFACILSILYRWLPANFERPVFIPVVVAGIIIWWSGTYWKYIQRITERFLPHSAGPVSATGENVVNRQTYMIGEGNKPDTTDIPMEKWIESGLPAFDRIYMPPPTVAGIHRLLHMDLIRQRQNAGGTGAGGSTGNIGNGRNEGNGVNASRTRGGNTWDLQVLNMSELTPLALEIPYTPEKNQQLPLWYHLGVGMFNKQAALLETRIREHHYQLVLFEYVPGLNNFYPFRVRDSLKLHYQLVDSFPAPRSGDTRGNIEVYVLPKDSLLSVPSK